MGFTFGIAVSSWEKGFLRLVDWRRWNSTALLGFHSRVADDLRPLRHLRADVFRELLGGAALRLDALGEEALAHVRHGEDPERFGVELLDDGARRAGRRDQPEP